jgi:hypothetical protein
MQHHHPSYPPSISLQVGANLGKPGYMADISRATADIDVQIIFANAGYILTGFFHTRWAARGRSAVCVPRRAAGSWCDQERPARCRVGRVDCFPPLPAAKHPQKPPFTPRRTAEQIQANIECNALSAVHITHHFLKRLVGGSDCMPPSPALAASQPT